MALKFQARGTQLNAYYATAFNDYAAAGNGGGGDPTIVASAGSGIFGGNLISIINTGSGKRAISWVGLDNFSLNGAFTILMRVVPNFTGSPAENLCLFVTGSSDGGFVSGLQIRGLTNGKINAIIKNNATTTLVNDDSASTVTYTSGTPIDVWITWTGASGAGTVKVYYASNGNSPSEIGSFTSSGAQSTRPIANIGSMIVGINGFGSGSDFSINELVVWDDVQVPSSYGARTNFITASSFEGYNYSDPGITNVALGTSYIFAGSTLTGSLVAPVAASGTAGAVDINNIKETIRYVLNAANVSGGSPIDLSNNMTARVKAIMKVNPEKIKLDVNIYPVVTIFTSKKDIQMKTIAVNEVTGKRRADLTFSIVGIVWNDTTADYREDSADEDVENLMENIEVVLRHYADLNGVVGWQFPTGVTYHTLAYDEMSHMRVGLMDLQVTVYY
jgi:hypothetical protein